MQSKGSKAKKVEQSKARKIRTEKIRAKIYIYNIYNIYIYIYILKFTYILRRYNFFRDVSFKQVTVFMSQCLNEIWGQEGASTLEFAED